MENKTLDNTLFDIAEAGNLNILSLLHCIKTGAYNYFVGRYNYITVDGYGKRRTISEQTKLLDQIVAWYSQELALLDQKQIDILSRKITLDEWFKFKNFIIGIGQKAFGLQKITEDTPITMTMLHNAYFLVDTIGKPCLECKPTGEAIRDYHPELASRLGYYHEYYLIPHKKTSRDDTLPL